jgi:hypothetical protein
MEARGAASASSRWQAEDGRRSFGRRGEEVACVTADARSRRCRPGRSVTGMRMRLCMARVSLPFVNTVYNFGILKYLVTCNELLRK